jgi:hypothetical protein
VLCHNTLWNCHSWLEVELSELREAQGVHLSQRTRKEKVMNEYLDPRPDPTRERERDNRWREGMNESEAGYFGPIIAVVVALLIGVMVFSNWGSTPSQNTQVGQNVEKNQPPDTPRDPNRSQ